MGVRIIVVLQLDMAHVWAPDPTLGKRILSHAQSISHYTGSEIEGGRVVEVMDDNLQSLMVVDGYTVVPLAYMHKDARRNPLATLVLLLRNAAKSLGYNIYRNYLRPSKLPSP